MKYFRTLNKQAAISLLEEYKAAHGEYPTTLALKRIKQANPSVLPSVRWIQSRGGIVPFYHSLGLHYTDARTGARRASVANGANLRSQSNDQIFAKRLIKTYGDTNVHWQSPYTNTLHRSDFKIYPPNGKPFFIDLFFPQDMNSLQGCVNLKLKKVSPLKVGAPVYFVVCNEKWIDSYSVEKYVRSRKTPMPSNIHLVHISDAPQVFSLL